MGKYSTQYLNLIMECFSIERATFHFSAINNGLINDTFLVLNEQNPLYVLQRVNHDVFENIDGLMSNIDCALNQLNSSDYKKIQLLKTREGGAFYENEDGYWRIMSYIENSTTFNTTTNDTIAFEAGRIISAFHYLLSPLSSTQFVDTIPRFHDLSLRKEQFNSALKKVKEDKLVQVSELLSFTKNTIKILEKTFKNSLPERICHNDTKLNNILFEKNSNKALCLIDLDTIMKGLFMYDFGDAVRTVVNTAPEDEINLSKITFNRSLFTSFVKGIAKSEPFLTRDEVNSLHAGVILMPFLHGLRALTDYLNNNIYYKVSYENQNLDRCISLYDFTQKALNEKEFMTQIISTEITPINS